MPERYVICTKYRPGTEGRSGFVGRYKCVWWYLEDARAAAHEKLRNRNDFKARVFIGAVDAAMTDILPGSGGIDVEERWRVTERTPVRYVETVRHSEERIVELVERRIVGERTVDQMDAFLRSTGAMK